MSVTPKHPPTFLIYGTEDTDVPYAESKNMDVKLAQAGVQREFVTVPDADHGLSETAPEKKVQIAHRAVEFLMSRMT